jgi:acetate kinase
VSRGGPLLVLNAGSSSLKAALFDPAGAVLWRRQGSLSWAIGAQGLPESGGGDSHDEALDALLARWFGVDGAPSLNEVELVGHRVVHGGTSFTAPVGVDQAVMEGLSALVPLAPLHNGPALALMRRLACRHPGLCQWACFDTAFHATIPPPAHTYAVPHSWRQQGLRQFGFHGLNHQHVSEFVGDPRPAGSPPAPLRLISCHLGAGCSLCAIRDGESIATTMGFTPLDGLVMATRSGSIDPGLLLHQLRLGVTAEEIDRVLNAESGLLGLSGLSGSMEELRRAATAGHTGAKLAIDVFRQRLLQGIGAMAASLGGVDVVALTGGIGEHDQALMDELDHALSWLQPFDLIRVPADEEGQIARQCRAAAAAQRLLH